MEKDPGIILRFFDTAGILDSTSVVTSIMDDDLIAGRAGQEYIKLKPTVLFGITTRLILPFVFVESEHPDIVYEYMTVDFPTPEYNDDVEVNWRIVYMQFNDSTEQIDHYDDLVDALSDYIDRLKQDKENLKYIVLEQIETVNGFETISEQEAYYHENY